MPVHAQPAEEKAKILRFADHVRIVKDTGFGISERAHDELGIAQELDDMLEEQFDEAAVPTYQLIQTYDRKKLKMKKHKRQKRREKMRIKLKWSGKL